jgi:hypothetical protein
MTLIAQRERLTADCPRMKARNFEDWCGAKFERWAMAHPWRHGNLAIGPRKWRPSWRPGRAQFRDAIEIRKRATRRRRPLAAIERTDGLTADAASIDPSASYSGVNHADTYSWVNHAHTGARDAAGVINASGAIDHRIGLANAESKYQGDNGVFHAQSPRGKDGYST